jgi:hypothetical protein
LLAFCILIAAFDLAALRKSPGDDRALLDLFALPMVNILVFTHYIGRRRRGERSLFLFGFQLMGWTAVLSYLGLCRLRPLEMSLALAYPSEWVHWTTLNHLDFDAMKRLDPTFTLAWRLSKASQLTAVSAVLTAVILLFATCGGIFVRRSC